MSEKRKLSETDVGNDKEAIFRFSSTLTFIIVILVIGVPMWWKTTEVYRVALPYTEISDLLSTPIKAKVNIGIFTHDEERTKTLLHELTLYFKDHQIGDLRFYNIKLDKKLAEEAHSPAVLETLAQKTASVKEGDFMFIEWVKLTEEVLMNSGRAAFISSNATASKIQQVIRSWLLQEYRLKLILGSVTTVSGQKLHHNTPPPQPQYDILLSVLNPNPELQKLNWNVRLAAERYIEPYLQSLSPLSNFTIKSQWKYQVKFDHVDRQTPDESKLGRHFMLHQDHLPQIITSLEKRLGNQVSSYPCVHLVFYMPPCKKGPLHIYKKNGERASTSGVDSFISAKWGGIVIVNPSEKLCMKYMENEDVLSEVDVNSHDAMEIALYILRKIFDMESNQPIPGVNMTEQETILPRNWEVDTYLRTGAIHLIHSAQSTLNSLIQLLGGISYIVIKDQVGTEIKNSYVQIVRAKECLADGQLKCAVTHARNAFIAAEAAFFDPSLLALLYFPDEQKYAIYIPLFLPIMIPVILSLSSIKKFFSKKTEEDKEEKKTKED